MVWQCAQWIVGQGSSLTVARFLQTVQRACRVQAQTEWGGARAIAPPPFIVGWVGRSGVMAGPPFPAPNVSAQPLLFENRPPPTCRKTPAVCRGRIRRPPFWLLGHCSVLGRHPKRHRFVAGAERATHSVAGASAGFARGSWQAHLCRFRPLRNPRWP